MAFPVDRVELAGPVLRRERIGDEELVAATVMENLDHLRPWMPWAVPESGTLDAQRERLIEVEKRWGDGTDYSFLLLDSSETELLGVFGLHRRIGPGGIELGYWLSRHATGRGFATMGARELTAAALRMPDVSQVEIHCDEANQRSRRIPERLGYRLDRIEPDEVKAPAEVGRSMIWVFPP
jgi:RimJ/RimL family protein N-acetyltransferase